MFILLALLDGISGSSRSTTTQGDRTDRQTDRFVVVLLLLLSAALDLYVVAMVTLFFFPPPNPLRIGDQTRVWSFAMAAWDQREMVLREWCT